MARCMARAAAPAAPARAVLGRASRPAVPLPRSPARPLAPRVGAWRARRGVAVRADEAASTSSTADDLAAVRALLTSNAEQLAAVPPAVAATADPETGAAQTRMARLIDEERRLAQLEAQLAGAEQGLSVKERALLEQMLTAQRATTSTSAQQQMRAQLEATEAEAAALRAVITAGRTPAGGFMDATVLERPTVRQVMDWSDVDWAALSTRERLQTWWDIVIGKTLDEWADEWAISRAEGFGLKGLSTLLLAATVIICAAYSLLAMTTTAASSGGVIAPAVAALGAKPFALPTSTLLVVVRVVLSSVLVIAEQICTFIYYMPAMFVAPVAGLVLWHRQQCKEAGVLPIWARTAPPPRATKQVVLLKKVPAPLVPPIYYKGVTLPDAIAELAERPGAVWPPKIAAQPKKQVAFTLAEDVDRLLYGGGSAKAPPAPGAELPTGPVRPPPAGGAPGEDWRLAQLQSTLGRAAKGVAATPRGAAAAPLPSPAAVEAAAAAADSGASGMAAVRARFSAMQTSLKTGADQAAEDAAKRKF